MITRITTLATLLLVAVLAGCAHPISLSPDLARVTSATATKIDKKAGLSLADADRSREVTTPGGGGDKLSYFPYRDLEHYRGERGRHLSRLREPRPRRRWNSRAPHRRP